MPGPHYFHGTDATLQVGDVLVPGVEIPGADYGRSKHVYMTTDAEVPRRQALREAYIWACTACQVAEEERGSATPFAHVYIVEPLGPIEMDGAEDVPRECVRTTRARIIDRISDLELYPLHDYGPHYLRSLAAAHNPPTA